MQVASRPLLHNDTVASGSSPHELVEQKGIWAQPIHRIVADGISPEQAVDEAITRIKQILAEQPAHGHASRPAPAVAAGGGRRVGSALPLRLETIASQRFLSRSPALMSSDRVAA